MEVYFKFMLSHKAAVDNAFDWQKIWLKFTIFYNGSF